MQYTDEIRRELDELTSGLEKKELFHLEPWLIERHRELLAKHVPSTQSSSVGSLQATAGDEDDNWTAFTQALAALVDEIMGKLTKDADSNTPTEEARRTFSEKLHSITADIEANREISPLKKSLLQAFINTLIGKSFVLLSAPQDSLIGFNTLPLAVPLREATHNYNHTSNRSGHDTLEYANNGMLAQEHGVWLSALKGDRLKRYILDTFAEGLRNAPDVHDYIAQIKASYEYNTLLPTPQNPWRFGAVRFFGLQTESRRELDAMINRVEASERAKVQMIFS